MGFFDFLASPAQDPTLQDPEAGKKKKILATKGGVTKEGEEFFSSNPTSQEPPSPEQQKATVQQAEDSSVKAKVQKAHLDIQDAYGSAIKAIAKAVGANAPNPYGAGASMALAQTLDRVQDRAIRRENAAQLSDDLQQLGAQLKDTALIDAAAKLSKAYKAQLELEELRKPGNALAVSPEEVAAKRAQLDAEIQKKSEELPTVGEIRRPQFQQDLQALQQERLRIDQAVPRKAVAPQEEAPTSATPVANQFKTLGVKKEQLLTSMLSLLEANGISLDDLDDDVPTQAGLMRLLSSMDKEGTVAQKMAADLMAEKQGFQEQMQREEAAMKGEQAAADKRVAGLQSEMGQTRSQLKELYRELNSQPFMRSWIGILSFVILSMLSGPKNAAILLGFGRNKNAVQGEIDALKEDLRYMGRQMEKEENYSQQVRREAIDRMANRGKEERMYSRDVSKMMINHQLVLARAKQNSSNTGAQRLMISKLEGDYNRIVGRMKDASERMRDPYADDRDKQRAAREHQAALAEMEFLDQKLRALTERMLPGTYSSEEEEAQTP